MSPGRQSLIVLIFILAGAIVQSRGAHAIAVRYAQPDFLLIALACGAMLIGGYWGIILGFVAGYLTVALSSDPFLPFGTVLASRTIAGAFASGLQRSVIRDSVWVPPLVVFLTTIVCDGVYAAMAPHTWLHHPKEWLASQAGQILFNTVLSYPLYLVLRRLGVGLHREDPFGIGN